MPQITITIDEQQEAAIVDHIQSRRDFRIDGGSVWDGEKMVFLKAITFEFHKMQMPGTAAMEAAINER